MPALGTINSTQEMSHSNTVSATPGATVTLTIPSGRSILYSAWTAGEDESVVTSGAQTAGTVFIMKILNDATSARTITFSTGFVASATIVGTTSKSATIVFISNGTSFYEIARTLLL